MELEKVLGLQIQFDTAEEKIIEIWKKYVKDNPGTCANYFDVIAVHLIRSFLEKSKYEKIKKEAKIFYANELVDGKYVIDLVCTKQRFL